MNVGAGPEFSHARRYIYIHINIHIHPDGGHSVLRAQRMGTPGERMEAAAEPEACRGHLQDRLGCLRVFYRSLSLVLLCLLLTPRQRVPSGRLRAYVLCADSSLRLIPT